MLWDASFMSLSSCLKPYTENSQRTSDWQIHVILFIVVLFLSHDYLYKVERENIVTLYGHYGIDALPRFRV